MARKIIIPVFGREPIVAEAQEYDPSNAEHRKTLAAHRRWVRKIERRSHPSRWEMWLWRFVAVFSAVCIVLSLPHAHWSAMVGLGAGTGLFVLHKNRLKDGET